MAIESTPARADAAIALDQRLDRFLRGVQGRAFRYCRFGCAIEADAFDVIQDAMIDFCRRYRSRPSELWPGLFWRVLQSRLVDQQRRNQRHQRHFADRVDTLNGSEAPPTGDSHLEHRSMETWMEVVQTHAALTAAVRALPNRQREVLLMREWIGLDTKETAKALRISTGTVKTHLHRAIDATRRALAEIDHDVPPPHSLTDSS